MKDLPASRKSNLVQQELKDEILIYDLNRNKAFCLNQTSAIVYRHCDGKTTFDALKAKTKLTDDVILLALNDLQSENLLESNENFLNDFAGLSRRDVIRKIGFASLITLPVIMSLAAPTAAQSRSVCPTGIVCQGRCCAKGESCASASGCCPTAQLCGTICCDDGLTCLSSNNCGVIIG